MAAPRLPFLYPQLFKVPKAWDTCTVRTSFQSARKPHRGNVFPDNKRRQSTITQRYGSAQEPLPPPVKIQGAETSLPPPKEAETKQTSEAKQSKSKSDKEKATGKAFNDLVEEDGDVGEEPISENLVPKLPSLESAPEPLEDVTHPAQLPTSSSLSPSLQEVPQQLEKVLHMEAPTSMKPDNTKHHMTPTPYVHHFDSYTLVKDLGKGGFTHKQSVTIMKSIRYFLEANLDRAKEGLVSKSDVENETYLFRAACSELRNEIINTRKRAAESMRSERAHLQHETDILNQRLTQEAGALKDDLKGMFDDRKMAVRSEQRGMESGIQELNYKITVNLLGDSKGEVEGLRWFLTRRAAMFIGGMALLTLGYLRYSTYMAHLEQEQRKKVVTSSSGGGTIPARSISTQTDTATDAVLAGIEEEGKNDGISYVSLG